MYSTYTLSITQHILHWSAPIDWQLGICALLAFPTTLTPIATCCTFLQSQIEFANRKCEIDGHWGVRPNDSEPNPAGWTDYGPCYKPEVKRLMKEIKDVSVSNIYYSIRSRSRLDTDIDLDLAIVFVTHLKLYMDIAQRIRTLEIVGLCISLLALIISLAIFCAFRSLRNNRTKIHKNLFIAMVLQVIVRLTLYLDQFRRGKPEAATNTSLSAIENTVSILPSRRVPQLL